MEARMGRIFFLGLVMAFAACAASGQTRKPFPPGVVGAMQVDAGTEYLFLDRPSTVGGACKGWKAVSIQQPGRLGSGTLGTMCWKESNGRLLTATSARVLPQIASMDLVR
jgi:hypothetical protein